MKTMAMNNERVVTERNKYSSSYIMLYGLVTSVHTCFVHCISKSEITPSTPSLYTSPEVSIECIMCVCMYIYMYIYVYVCMSLFTSPARMKARYCPSIKYTPTVDMSIRKKCSVVTAGPI